MNASPNIAARLGLTSIPLERRKDTPPRKAIRTALELPETPHFFGESLVTGKDNGRKEYQETFEEDYM